MEEREKRLSERERRKRMTEEKATAQKKFRMKDRPEEEVGEGDEEKVTRRKYTDGKQRRRMGRRRK